MRVVQGLGELAQLGERLVCNQEVTGSSPVFSTTARGRRPPAAAPGSTREAGGLSPGVAADRGRYLTTEYPTNGSFP